MAVKLRLARVGSKKNPIYRVVAADARAPRDGRFLEIVGRYNPQTHPSIVELDETKVRDWLGKGLHGDMQWMARHGDLREKPDALRPGTLRVLSVRMDYATSADADDWEARLSRSRS